MDIDINLYKFNYITIEQDQPSHCYSPNAVYIHGDFVKD